MRLFNIWFRRMTPQHFVTVVEAEDIQEAWKQAKELEILHPIVGEKPRKARKGNSTL